MNAVTIVGGGVAGSVLGAALAQRGISCRIFERRHALRFGGGALILWSNALQSLARVGLARDAMRLGCELLSTDFRDAQGRLLWRLRTREVRAAGALPSVVLPRTKLLALLDESVRELLLEGELEDFELAPDGVRASFKGGRAVESQLLVGADGLRSTVRARLFGALPPPRTTGQAIWVGVSRFRAASVEPGRAVATVGNQLRFWFVAPSPEEVHWYATFPERCQPGDLGELLELFREFREPVADLIAATAESDVRKTSIADRAPSAVWGRDRATLLGDAIHPTTPDLGQGACQAIESAVTLAESLARFGAGPRALREYEALRRDRAARVSNTSYLTAVASAVGSPAAVALRDFGIAQLLPALAVPELRRILRGDPAR